MTQEEERALEALIQAEVDRAVAPYVGKAPPVVFRKLRELAERFLREQPTAVRVLALQVRNHKQLISGDSVKLPEDGAPATPTDAAADVGGRKV